jgi:hypothetical protein
VVGVPEFIHPTFLAVVGVPEFIHSTFVAVVRVPEFIYPMFLAVVRVPEFIQTTATNVGCMNSGFSDEWAVPACKC